METKRDPLKQYYMNSYYPSECEPRIVEAMNNGALVFQKFQCEKCEVVNTMPEANKFWASGKCEDCGHVTDIMKKGMNYTIIMSNDPEALEKMRKL